MKRYESTGIHRNTRLHVAGLVAIYLALSVSASAAPFQFTQSSEPLTFFSTNSTFEGGSTVTSLTASITLQGYHFAYWKLDGVPQRDALNDALNPFSFIITAPTDGRAVYLPEWQDANTNDIPDWWEWNTQGEPVVEPVADTDGDGLDLAEEYRRNTNPRIPDHLVDGGTSMGLSTTAMLIINTNMVSYTISSDPPGYILSVEGVTNRGAILVQEDAYGLIDNMRFACWTLNGVRQTDSTGRALSEISFPVLSNTTAKALFIAEDEDSDGDAVADWYEYHFTGSLSSSSNADDDGDGFDLKTECNRDYHAGLVDELRDGGISMLPSGDYLVIANTNLSKVSISSAPAELVETQQFITNKNTQIKLTNSYTDGAFHFCYWTLNGTIQTDNFGRARSNMDFNLQSNTVALALFVDQDEDLDSDGVADWFEYHFMGNLSFTSNVDGDTDGFDLKAEYERDYHAGLVDELRDGGISLLPYDALVIIDTNLTTYSIRSEPPGYVPSTSGITNRGSTIVQGDTYGLVNDMRFACWELNENIVTDTLGRAVSSLEFTVHQRDQLVAKYLSQWQDENTNGLPDWWEWNVAGGFVADTTVDSDGDGLSLAEEYRRDNNPMVREQFWDGGISIAYSAISSVSFAFFIRTEEILVNGITSSFFTKVPPGMGTFIIDANAHPALGDWDGDGDLDLFVGGSDPTTGSGQVRIFENAGSPLIINLVEQTTNFASIASAWQSITTPAPALGDWSGDGLADLAVGGDTNVIQLIVSDGSWAGSPPQIFGQAVASSSAIPAFGKIDNDNLVDLLVLTDSGTVDFFPNTGNSTNPYSEGVFISNILGIIVPNAVGLTTADVNEDGVTDILVSDRHGNIWEFHGGSNQ